MKKYNIIHAFTKEEVEELIKRAAIVEHPAIMFKELEVEFRIESIESTDELVEADVLLREEKEEKG